jgi:DNA invertase Pin-like site-specific DNA recombinase
VSGPAAISRNHLDRLAVIYVRLSTPAQVRHHRESTTRRYGLADEAVRLGWEARKTLVIDADLGHSGRNASARTGFQELVSRVSLGEVGAIFALEVSRPARSSADLQRLLEFCSLTDTLVIDADGIYDLQQFNDRLLLGLKDVMSVAELHVLAGRLLCAMVTRKFSARWRSLKPQHAPSRVRGPALGAAMCSRAACAARAEAVRTGRSMSR